MLDNRNWDMEPQGEPASQACRAVPAASLRPSRQRGAGVSSLRRQFHHHRAHATTTMQMHSSALPQPLPILLLNAPIVTSLGLFRHTAVSVEQARALLHGQPFESAIGHALTAQAISTLLQIHCPMRRNEVAQGRGQRAIVFRLRRRLPEGAVLSSVAELEEIGFEFTLLERME